ncbi:MAG: anthranilate phosphoribosyltransferase [Phycisphaeraceae bacterium]|nr:anthranilate phosphoribosyltransferase [Phycisphaeraceae bacterium]
MKDLLAQLVGNQPLSAEQAVDAFEQIMSGKAQSTQTAALLAMIQQRDATVDELVGAATVMRSKAAKVTVPKGLTAIDTCGTGGDHAGTFNISTASAIVAAGAGRPLDLCVAKHGNKSVTSKSGSSQVLDTLGVKLAVSTETLTKCLDQAGICFCFAPAHHPAMKHAGPVRADLGFRTLFNIVGPLTNPAGAPRQVMGVFSPKLTEMIAKVLLQLGSIHAMVVHGQLPDADGTHFDALDELSTSGQNRVSIVRDGGVITTEMDPTDLGLSLGHPSALKVDSPEASAKIITDILAGKAGAPREIVALNAAAALTVGGVAESLEDGLAMAFDAIDTGKAKAALDALIELTNQDQS